MFFCVGDGNYGLDFVTGIVYTIYIILVRSNLVGIKVRLRKEQIFNASLIYELYYI
jgi:hypothetical protein